jgi:hypothetical protein
LEESFGDDNKCIAAILMDLSKAFNLMILGEIPSYPVAFLMFNLFICLVTKSSFIGLKNNLSLFVLFVSILFILGWVLSNQLTNQSCLKN